MREEIGPMVDGVEAKTYRLRDGSGLEAVVTNLGAAVHSLFLEDEKGKTDVLLGFREPEKQLEKGPMFGVTLGRYAGKIRDAQCEVEGHKLCLTKSHGEYHAHGGKRGFDKRIFQTELVKEDQAVFTYYSVDGEEGYPGNLTLRVFYQVKDRSLCIRYEARADMDTPVNISNHMYFNLSGNAEQNIAYEKVMIQAREIGELDEQGLPTGKALPVGGTSMDFSKKKSMEVCLKNPTEMMRRAKGLDHDYLLDTEREGAAAALYDEVFGRKMELFTDMPCIHFYVPDFGGMNYMGKGNKIYNSFCGVCFEPMYPFDSINSGLGGWPLLKKDELWVHEIRYVFDW